MTREEAIIILETDSKKGWSCLADCAEEARLEHVKYLEAQDMAIKALEQEPRFILKSDGSIEQIKDCNNCIFSQKTGNRDNIHIPDFSHCKWIFDFNNEVGRSLTINTAFLATLADRIDILERKLAEYERNTRKPY